MIIGAGYIGLEMAEALRANGLTVTIIEQLPSVLPTVDPELGALVRVQLERNEVQVINDVAVTAIELHGGGLAVIGDTGPSTLADIVPPAWSRSPLSRATTTTKSITPEHMRSRHASRRSKLQAGSSAPNLSATSARRCQNGSTSPRPPYTTK